jgi:hypothetical protein
MQPWRSVALVVTLASAAPMLVQAQQRNVPGAEFGAHISWLHGPGATFDQAALASAGGAGADLEQVATWLAGSFDNYAQVWEQREQGVRRPPPHVHADILRVHVPALGPYVFSVRQYLDGDPSQVRAHALYVLALDPATRAIELRVHEFADPGIARGAPLGVSALAALAPSGLVSEPGCEVVLTREGDRFAGSTSPGACHIAARSEARRAPVASLVLSASELSLREFGSGPFAANSAATEGGDRLALRRCRTYQGWAALKVADTGEDQRDYEGFFGLRLHDQGQVIPLVTKGGQRTKYSLQLAHLVQQSSKVPVMVLKVFEEGKEQAIAYAWASPGSERIGLNLRWIQAGLTLVP